MYTGVQQGIPLYVHWCIYRGIPYSRCTYKIVWTQRLWSVWLPGYKYSGFRLMWPPVNAGSPLMWTFHQEWNLLYITCTKLLRLIWANIRLLWATQCQAHVKTIRFTHVVHVYKFILAFACGKTSSAHIYGSMICIADALFAYLPCLPKYRCNSCIERLTAAAWVVFTTSSCLFAWHAAAVMCMYSTYITVPTWVIVHTCMYISILHTYQLFTCTVHVFHPPEQWLSIKYKTSYSDNLGSCLMWARHMHTHLLKPIKPR